MSFIKNFCLLVALLCIGLRTGSTQSVVGIAPSGFNTSDLYGFFWYSGNDLLVVGAIGVNEFAGSAYFMNCSIPDNCTVREILGEMDAPINLTSNYTVAIAQNLVALGNPSYTSNQGMVSIYNCSDSNCTLQTNLTLSNATSGDLFGCSLSAYGNMLLVGACGRNGTGAAYLYNCTSTNCTLVTSLLSPNASKGDQFGWSVGIFENITVVGASLSNMTGAAYLFDCSMSPNCTFITTMSPSNMTSSNMTSSNTTSSNFTNALFGSRVYIANGTVFIGAEGMNNNTGAVFVYNCTADNCTLASMLMPSNLTLTSGAYFGSYLIARGDLLAVGAGNYNGSLLDIYLFNCSVATNCTQVAYLNLTYALTSNLSAPVTFEVTPNITVNAQLYETTNQGEIYIFYSNSLNSNSTSSTSSGSAPTSSSGITPTSSSSGSSSSNSGSCSTATGSCSTATGPSSGSSC